MSEQRGGGRGKGNFRGGRGGFDNRGGRDGSDGGRGGFENRGGARGGFTRGGSARGGSARGGSENRGGSARGGYDNRGGGRGGGSFRGARGGRGGNSFGNTQFTHRPAQSGSVIYQEGIVPEPDKDVQALENVRVKATKGQELDQFPGRPSYGTQGRAIVLRTNYLHLKAACETGATEVPLYRYALGLSSTGETLSKSKTRLLVQTVIRGPIFANMQVATDYSSIIVTSKKLDLGPSGRKEGTVELVDAVQAAYDDADTPEAQRARAPRTKRYLLQPTGEFSLADLMSYLRSPQAGAHFGSRSDVVQLLNIIISRAPNTAADVYSMGQNKFFPHGHTTLEESVYLGRGLEALRGYYSSVRISTNRILLNLNVASAAFYSPMSVINLMGEFLGFNTNPLSKQDSHELLTSVEGFLYMLRVQTDYLKPRDASGKLKQTSSGRSTILVTKTIRSFAYSPRFGNANQVKFTWTDPSQPSAAASQISVAEFFQKQHGIKLNHPDWPVLNVGSKEKSSFIPMELARVVHGQPVRRLLSGPQTTNMINFAARQPRLNAESITGTLSNPGHGLRVMGLASQDQQAVNSFGFKLGTEMLTVPGRILPPPDVFYGGERLQARDGSWNLAGVKFTKPGSFGKWGFVVLDYPGKPSLLPKGASIGTDPVTSDEELARKLQGSMAAYGIEMGEAAGVKHCLVPRPTKANRAAVDKEIRTIMAEAEAKGIEILVVVLKEADKWLYSRIKFHADVTHGIQTINCVGSKLQKPRGQDMYIGNIALKFNTKGGGTHHTQKDLSQLDGNLMLIGIDVTHPSPESAKGSPSIAAVVANIDNNLCQWPGSLRCQEGRTEMVSELAKMIDERLVVWQKHNRDLPSKIMVYRDGVSEGQYSLVLQFELPAIQAAFKKRYGDAKKWPKLTIIIVGKRHHTRFYPTDKQHADFKNGNPLPGTVVDRGITDHFMWDFFLQAHRGLQGTARPAHYVVLKDELKFTQDQLEQFTHKMCYQFNRATKAVSICPPAYYADLLCERGRMYLYSTLNESSGSSGTAYNAQTAEWKGGVHARLQDKTFYI